MVQASSLTSSVPYEVIREILRYVPDIDVRRAFGVFNKLNAKEHEHLNYVMRQPYERAPSRHWVLTHLSIYSERYRLMHRVWTRENQINGMI